MLKRYRNLIRYHTQTYTLEDDNMVEAWRVFTWALAAEHGDLKAKGKEVCIKNEPPYCIGLDKLKMKDPNAEELRCYFLEYFRWVCPMRTSVLDEAWQKFLDNSEMIKFWSEGEFTNFTEFKSAPFFN
jgi:hypothetical protein